MVNRFYSAFFISLFLKRQSNPLKYEIRLSLESANRNFSTKKVLFQKQWAAIKMANPICPHGVDPSWPLKIAAM